MNRSTKLRNCITLATLLVVSSLLVGCIYPHTYQRSAEVRGRVLDAETRQPIKGAKIYLVQPPHYPTYTDADGRFRMKARTQMFWGGNPAGGDWPAPKNSVMEITHPNYQPSGVGDGENLLKPRK